MAIVYCMPVYEQAMSGTTSQGTQASLNSKLAQAEKFFVQARVTQVSGTSPTLTVTLEHSNDDVNFTTKAPCVREVVAS